MIAEYTDILKKNEEAPIPKEKLAEEIKEALRITSEELGGDTGMGNIVKNYYTNSIASIENPEFRKKAVLLIEDTLVIHERRVSFPEPYLNISGYPSELLDYLVSNTRLIRVDRLKNQRYFEISHDRLLPAIIASAARRKEEDKKLQKIIELENERKAQEERTSKLQQEMKDEQDRNRMIRKTAKRLRWLAGIMSALVVGMIWVSIYANNLRVKSKLANVSYWVDQEDYKKADSVLSYKLSTSGVRGLFNIFYKKKFASLRDTIEQKKEQKQKFDSLSDKANTLLASGDEFLGRAYELLKEAEKTAFDPKDERRRIPARLDSLMPYIQVTFNRYVDKAQAFYNSDALVQKNKKDTADIMAALKIASRLREIWLENDPGSDTTQTSFHTYNTLRIKLGL